MASVSAARSGAVPRYSERIVDRTHNGLPSPSEPVSSARKSARSRGPVRRRSSSAWSIVTSTSADPPANSRSWWSRDRNPSGPVTGSSISRSTAAGSAATPWADSAREIAKARLRSGREPGTNGGRTTQRSGRSPSRGSTPASSSDDLPLPDGPTTPTHRPAPRTRAGCRRSRTWAVSSVRPKKTAASSAAKADRPGYGDWVRSQAKASAGSRPMPRRPSTSRATMSPSPNSTSCNAPTRSSRGPPSTRTGKTGLPVDRARTISAKHQRDATEAAEERKTTASQRRSAA